MRTNCFNMSIEGNRSVMDLILLKYMLEFEELSVDFVFKNFYEEYIKKKKIDFLILQTKKLVLHIFSLKFPIKPNKVIIDSWIFTRKALNKLENRKVPESIEKDLLYLYSYIIANPLDSESKKHILHRMIFFIFVSEFNIQIKMDLIEYSRITLFLRNLRKCHVLDINTKNIVQWDYVLTKRTNNLILDIEFHELLIIRFTFYIIKYAIEYFAKYKEQNTEEFWNFVIKNNLLEIFIDDMCKNHLIKCTDLCQSLYQDTPVDVYDFASVYITYTNPIFCRYILELLLGTNLDFPEPFFIRLEGIFDEMFKTCFEEILNITNESLMLRNLKNDKILMKAKNAICIYRY